jgi:branched-chain amino acid transport system permease protein
MSSGNRLRPIASTLLVIFFTLLPLCIKDPYVIHLLIAAGLFSSAALGVRLVMNTGPWHFGQGAFMTIGAYGSAIMVTRVGLSFWYALPLSALGAALLGLVFGYPALKVKGAYFAILTFALSGVLKQIIVITPGITGGLPGMYGIPVPSRIDILGLSVDFTSKVSFYYLVFTLLFITVLVMYRLDKSRLGPLFKAIMQNDTLSESVGVNVLLFRILAFVIACVVGGLVGAISAHYYTIVHPDFFGVWQSIYLVAYVIIGGVGSVFGPIIGSFLLIITFELLRSAQAYQAVTYAALMIVVILFLPGGIISLGPLISARAVATGKIVKKVVARRYQKGTEEV